MTKVNENCESLTQGDVRFYTNYVPTLPVGDYLINVTQQSPPGVDECYGKSQIFSVQGPRYVLPTGDIFSTYPPDNGMGIFDQFLPHVVLAQRDLPWERPIFGDEDPTPWMALLLFVDGETFDGKGGLLPPPGSSDGKCKNRTCTTAISAKDLFSKPVPPSGDTILWPNLGKGKPEWYETDDFLTQTMCNVIDVSPQAFNTLVPGKADLKYLTHVRQVNPTAKDSEVLKVSGDGWYSVVVGNRLPDPSKTVDGAATPGQRNIVHMVSLEGFEDYIGDTGASVPTTYDRVRLISFKSWSFNCLPELGQSFSELMQGLLKDDSGQEKPTSFMLQVELPPLPSDETQFAYQAMQNGYVPLRYQTRLGEQTFAWYRGPFSPVPVKDFVSTAHEDDPDQLTGWKPFDRASAAIIYDKSYGVFDVSYGVAWETGRLLALSDKHFGQELLDWQRKGHYLIDLIVQRLHQIDQFSNFDPDDPDPSTETELLELIKPYWWTDDFVQNYLVNQLVEQLAPNLEGQTTDPPDEPFPAYPDSSSVSTDPDSIAGVIAQSKVQDAIYEAGGQELEAITDWLAQLYLLKRVPFEDLVPHADVLPSESVRFFYLDPNWLAALVEGALSIGIESSRDVMYQDLMKDLIWNTTFEGVHLLRDRELEDQGSTLDPSGIPFDQEALTGMLLRSSVVSGWPGLEVNGYLDYTTNDDGEALPDLDSHIKLLRMERLSSDVLLCLWPAIPKVVTIDEPHEGVEFGFQDPPTGEGYYLYLRSLDTSSGYGTRMCSDEEIEKGTCQHEIDAEGANVIDSATRIVKISASGGLLDQIKENLGVSDVNVYDFAVQMIKVPEEAVFAAQSSQEESVVPKKDALATKSSRKKPVGAGRQLRDKKGRKRNER